MDGKTVPCEQLMNFGRPKFFDVASLLMRESFKQWGLVKGASFGADDGR